MAIQYVPQEHASVRPHNWPASATSRQNAKVKPWVSMALECIGRYLNELSAADKTTLFGVLRSNPDRLGHWQAEGHFASLRAIQAKIRDWRRRGLGGPP
jgi:hypothetical protein